MLYSYLYYAFNFYVMHTNSSTLFAELQDTRRSGEPTPGTSVVMPESYTPNYNVAVTTNGRRGVHLGRRRGSNIY